MEVGISIKGHRDQIERDFWRETFGETHFQARTHVCWIFFGKYSLVSVKHLM